MIKFRVFISAFTVSLQGCNSAISLSPIREFFAVQSLPFFFSSLLLLYVILSYCHFVPCSKVISCKMVQLVL